MVDCLLNTSITSNSCTQHIYLLGDILFIQNWVKHFLTYEIKISEDDQFYHVKEICAKKIDAEH